MSGYRTDWPGLFSWLGVTMYLSTDAIFGTLRAVAALAPGTEIIFEYTVPKDLVDEETQKMLAVVLPAAKLAVNHKPAFSTPPNWLNKCGRSASRRFRISVLMTQRRDILTTARMLFGLPR
jgi:O-methyltransferase involved in polyketide biosynthesis